MEKKGEISMKIFNILLAIITIIQAIMCLIRKDITMGAIYMLIANLYVQQIFKDE